MTDVTALIDSRDCAGAGCPNAADDTDGFCHTCRAAQRPRKPWNPTEMIQAPAPAFSVHPQAHDEQPAPNHRGNRSTIPWTPERIVAVLNEWRDEHGEYPYAAEWRAAGEGRPTENTVRTKFGSWEAAIQVARRPSPPEPEVAASHDDPPSAVVPPSDAVTPEAGDEAPDPRRWATAFDWNPWDVDVDAGENPNVFDAGFLFDEAKNEARRAVAAARASLARLRLAQQMFRDLSREFHDEATPILEDTNLDAPT